MNCWSEDAFRALQAGANNSQFNQDIVVKNVQCLKETSRKDARPAKEKYITWTTDCVGAGQPTTKQVKVGSRQ